MSGQSRAWRWTPGSPDGAKAARHPDSFLGRSLCSTVQVTPAPACSAPRGCLPYSASGGICFHLGALTVHAGFSVRSCWQRPPPPSWFLFRSVFLTPSVWPL